jgi:hypothetical protein
LHPTRDSLIISEREDVEHIVGIILGSHVNLRQLILENCKFGDESTGILTKIVALYPELEVLSLRGCYPITSAGHSLIAQLKKITELNLQCCHEVDGETFRLIVDSCQHLKKLRLELVQLLEGDIICYKQTCKAVFNSDLERTYSH